MTSHTGSVNGSSRGGLLALHLEHPRGRTYGWFTRVTTSPARRQMSTFAIRAVMYKYTALVAWPAGL